MVNGSYRKPTAYAPVSDRLAGAWPRQMRNGYRELDGPQLSGTLTRRTTFSTILNPRFR